MTRTEHTVMRLLALAVMVVGCAGKGGLVVAPGGPISPAPTLAAAPAQPDTLIATATVDTVAAHDTPGGDVTHRLDHPTDSGAPRTFLVDRRRGDWLEVLLPVRPNGTTGWVDTDDVTLTSTDYAVEVDLAAFQLTVTRGDRQILTTPIGYGATDTPTPGGRYYLAELLRPSDPDGPYGPFAFGLSGYSDVHRDFAGGKGVIGIHGTDEPTSIGSRVSNGCIRVPNDVIEELAVTLPLGTPATIVEGRR